MTQEEILVTYKAGELTIPEVLQKLEELKKSFQIPFPKKREKYELYYSLIFKNVLSPLSSVPCHHDIECIERFFSDQFPVHLAIHRVKDAKEQKRSYTELHSHEEQEINIIINDEGTELIYEIKIGDEIYNVKSNSSIWIPSNIPHSSNVLKGSGYFIALRLKPDTSMVEKFISNFSLPTIDIGSAK